MFGHLLILIWLQNTASFFFVFVIVLIWLHVVADARVSRRGAPPCHYRPQLATRKDVDTQTGREVREDESIPELEEDDAVVKQVASEFSAPRSGAHSRRSSARRHQQQLSN